MIRSCAFLLLEFVYLKEKIYTDQCHIHFPIFLLNISLHASRHNTGTVFFASQAGSLDQLRCRVWVSGCPALTGSLAHTCCCYTREQCKIPRDFTPFPSHSLLLLFLVLIDFSLSVKAATLIFISGRGSAVSSAKQGISGSNYNLVKNK